AEPEGGVGEIIRKDQNVVVSVVFSVIKSAKNVADVKSVSLEYYVEDLKEDFPTPLPPISMTEGIDGVDRATLPSQPANSVVRYRINAVRGTTSGVVRPRASDPLQWQSYFVTPTITLKNGKETQADVYHLFIKPGLWTNLETWLAKGREYGSDGCTVNNLWD